MPDPKSTPSSLPEIVPFGKYRGQPAEVLLQDPKYAEWLQGQDWFRQRYQSLNIFISNFGQPADTPEHNAIQVRFLDPGFRLKLAIVVTGGDIVAHADSSRLSAMVNRMLSDPRAADKKHKEYPPNGHPLLSLGSPSFESGGVDASFCVTYGADVCAWSEHGEVLTYSVEVIKPISVEIKPSLGDDFPGVLRQMRSLFEQRGGKANEHALLSYHGVGERVLLYSSYHGTGATEEQVISVFASAGYKMVRLDTVESVFIPPFDATFERTPA